MNHSKKNFLTEHFSNHLIEIDPELATITQNEIFRQKDSIELIASENFVSRATLETVGSIIMNRTVEGYPGRRYYGGTQTADEIERLAISRAKKLFGCGYANVQPHSGSQANQAVYLALLKPGDTILSMDLKCGGHLSHGAKPSLIGKWMNVIQYGVNENTGLIDFKRVQELAFYYKPKLIICGGSAYSREIDFKEFRDIADTVGAYLLADISHFSGLVVGGLHLSPVKFAHIITTTTYKSLRGVRGGVILTNDKKLAEKIDSSIFPGLQGSSLLNNLAGKALCFGEALKPNFREYAKQVLNNARCLATVISRRGLEVVTGSTDTPLILLDLRSLNLSGQDASDSLERAGLTCNKNLIPGDRSSANITSGLRFGVSAGTTRGFCEPEFELIGNMICDVLYGLNKSCSSDNREIEYNVRQIISNLCTSFPIYDWLPERETDYVGQSSNSQIKKRSVKIAGHLTSVSIEQIFWDGLKSIARRQGESINSLISKIDRERDGNLSSAIRIFVHQN